MFFQALILSAALVASPPPSLGNLQLESAQSRVNANPSDAAAHYDLCRAFYDLEDWDAAITQCEQAVKHDPRATYEDMLGRVYGAKAEQSSWYQAVGYAKRTRAAFEAAVAADPKNVAARRDLADYYNEAPAMLGGGKDKALQQAAALDKISPSGAAYIRARVAETTGDKMKAEQLFKDSVKLSGADSAAALSELASFYRREQRYDDMQATIDRLAADPRPGVALYDGAAMLIRAGRNLPGAIKMLDRYIGFGGTDEEPIYRALYQLGLAYQKSGDNANAQAKWKKSTDIADFAPAKKALKDLVR